MSWLSQFLSTPAPVTPAAPVVVAHPAVAAPAALDAVFAAAFKLLLKYEGGFGDDPRDAGNWTGGACGVGACLGTKYGVGSSSYADALSHLSAADRAGMPATVRDLTVDQAGVVYRARYWATTRCDELPPALALVAFDSAVNSGVGRSIRWLQAAVGCAVDGGFGPGTMAAVHAAVAAKGAVAVASRMLDERLAFLEALPTWGIYGHGWGSRVQDLRSHIGSFPA